MRPAILAALTALTICAGPDFAAAQPGGDEMQIDWEVKNRFRLFRRDADFQHHVVANRTGSQLAAERWLSQATDGRGWAKDVVDHLCVDTAGNLLETCERDGERENYLVPQTHRVEVRLTGTVPADSTCNWSFDDGTIPPQQVNASCAEAVQPRLRFGKPTIAAVGITRPNNTVESVSTEIQVRDLLIAGLGDSVAAGEGNPDRPVTLADEGFCFRRFLGTVRSEYFRPSRAGYDASKACDDNPAGPGAAATDDWMHHVLFHRRGPADFFPPSVLDVNVTGRAGTSAAAFRLDTADIILDRGLHHRRADFGFDGAGRAGGFDIGDLDHGGRRKKPGRPAGRPLSNGSAARALVSQF